jgi:predicted DNA-binding protein
VSPRTGRPKSDHSKDTMLRVRIDDELTNMLDVTSKRLNITKSDVVRNGIKNEYKKANKGKV